MLGHLKKIWIKRVTCRNDAIRYSRYLGVKIGEGCRVLDDPVAVFGSEPYLISVGDHVTITGGVRFITHDGGVWVFRKEHPEIDVFGSIVVGNNVFIGFNVLVLPNVTIGDNCVIAAGSIVSRSIPPNTVAIGVPARPVKTLKEYWQKIEPVASHIRSLNEEEKAAVLIKRFGPKK